MDYEIRSKADPYPQYMTASEESASNSSLLSSHLAATNPHGITPNLIGAAAISHTHAASAINSEQLAIANGGTGANNAAAALTNLGGAPISHVHAEHRHIILPYRFERLTTQSRINFNFYLADTLYCGYLLSCIVGGHRGGYGLFLSRREIFLSRIEGNLNFEVISSLDRGYFSGIFEFSTTPNGINIRINNGSISQRQDFGIYAEIVGSGANLAYPVFSSLSYT